MSENQQDLATFKVIIVGESGAGKSTILVRYVQNKYISTNTTVCIDQTYKYVEHAETKFKLQLWDTAGQQRFRTIVKNFFQLSKAACIVFDITNQGSFKQCKYWLEEISMKCGTEIPKILIANKSDLLNPTQINQFLENNLEIINKLKEEYNCQLYVASGKTGENVQQTFEKLVQGIYDFYLKKTANRIKKIKGGSKIHEMDQPKREIKPCC